MAIVCKDRLEVPCMLGVLEFGEGSGAVGAGFWTIGVWPQASA
jgi:hypothetical protein